MKQTPFKTWNFNPHLPLRPTSRRGWLVLYFYISLLTLNFQLSTSQAQFNPQTKEITNNFFPELELEISTPAFKKESGFTNYQEMMDWLDLTLKPHSENVSLSFIGESQKGKKIPMVLISRRSITPKTKVWMQGGLHGDEPAGTEAMLHLIDRLLNEPKYKFLLKDLELAIVPMANIDGYEKQKRESANGIDLNRDQTRFKAPESVSLKTAFSKFGPAVALDFHEYRPFRKDFTRLGKGGITNIYDAMFLYSGNLNVPENLRKLTKSPFVGNAKQVLEENHLRTHDYISTQKSGGQVEFNLGSVHSRSSATSFALSNCVSTLLEIRGVGIGRTSFKRRVKSSFLIAISYLETTVKERQNLESVLAEAEKAQNPVVVTSKRKVEKDTIQAIDLYDNKEIKLPVIINNALESKPELQRKRPFAYLISASEKNAIHCLKILGLKIDSLSEEKEIDVQVFGSSAKSEEEEKPETDEEEGVENQKETNTNDVKRKFSKGTYVVYLNQKFSNLACEVLEPENVNGFVSTKVIKFKDGQELPVYRYMKSEKLGP